MIQTIVEYLNLRIATLGRIADLRGITERRKREVDGVMVPYCYVGSGEFTPVELDNGNVGWWRGRSGFTMEPVQVIGRAVKQQRASYPLRFVAVLRRELSTADDAFMPSRLAEDIANALNFDNGDIVGMLKAINVESRASGGEYDAATIWPAEFQTSIPDLRYDLAMVAIDVTIEVVGKYSCWEGECATDPDILRLFNFCDPSVIARLTATQVACLEDALCDPCADAAVTVNTNPFGTAPSGGAINVPVVNGGANQVGSIVAGEVVIGNNSTFINGTQVTDQEAEVDANIFVTLDGTQSGTWNAGTQTWEVTGAACADANLEINGVQQETIASGATFNLIATLDGVAGGTYNAATDTLAFTSTGGWVRPSDWRTLPTLTAASEAGYVLLLVYENRLNQFTLQIPNGTVDWGDGTTSAASGAVRTKTYTYSTIAQTVFVDPITGENYKQVIIGITRLGAAITTVDFTASAATSPINAPQYAVDYNLSFPNCTDFRVGLAGARDARFAKILKIWALGTLGGICRIGNTSNLRILQLPTTFSGNLGGNFGRGMGAVAAGDINCGTAINCHSLFYLSNIISHGNLTANSTVLLNSYAYESFGLETFGTVTANTCTNIEFAWYNCTGLTTIGLLTLPICTSYFAAFYNTQLTAIRFADSTACTNTASMIGLCPALQLLHCPNLTRGVNFTGTSIGNYGMNIFASGDGVLNGIGTASGAQTITVTGTPYGQLLTALDATALAIRLVMTGKGYTVVN